MIELKFGTKILIALKLIRDGDVNPIIDFDGVRYSIDIREDIGMLKWTPFDLTTQLIIGTKTFTYPYAAHNILEHAILGPSSKSYPSLATNTTFPNFPVILDNGRVIP